MFFAFKSSPYGKETNHFMLCHFIINILRTHVTHMRHVGNDRYAYDRDIVQ